MTKQSLTKLHLDLNNLFYKLFDNLSVDERAMLQNTLAEIKQLLKGDF